MIGDWIERLSGYNRDGVQNRQDTPRRKPGSKNAQLLSQRSPHYSNSMMSSSTARL